MNRDIKIHELDNGYLVTMPGFCGFEEAYPTLDDVFSRLLSVFEGRTPRFDGNRFGEVTIQRTKAVDSEVSR